MKDKSDPLWRQLTEVNKSEVRIMSNPRQSLAVKKTGEIVDLPVPPRQKMASVCFNCDSSAEDSTRFSLLTRSFPSHAAGGLVGLISPLLTNWMPQNFPSSHLLCRRSCWPDSRIHWSRSGAGTQSRSSSILRLSERGSRALRKNTTLLRSSVGAPDPLQMFNKSMIFLAK